MDDQHAESGVEAALRYMQERITSLEKDRDEWKELAGRLYAERDAARQALRDLVDATSWFQEEMVKSGHIQVNEDAMNVAMALVVEWFKDQGG